MTRPNIAARLYSSNLVNTLPIATNTTHLGRSEVATSTTLANELGRQEDSGGAAVQAKLVSDEKLSPCEPYPSLESLLPA